MPDRCLGIDLGTCYSSIALHAPGQPLRYVKDPSSGQTSYSIPSSAIAGADGAYVFGERAESRKGGDALHYCSQFKRDLGSKIPYDLAGRRVHADEITARFLGFLVALASGLGTTEHAAVTVPAEYSERKRAIVRRAARDAGLPRVQIVDEPVAALAAAMHEGRVVGDGHVLVYDLGGGTFDCALIRIEGDESTVLGTRGLSDFGGSDIDRVIERDFAERAGDALGERLAGLASDDDAARATALKVRFAATELCRRIKHELSYEPVASGELLLAIPYELTRSDLERLVRPSVERTIEVCRRLIAEHQLTPDQVAGVVLVGGASRMPLVHTLLGDRLGRPVWPVGDPELAVCAGAALLGSSGYVGATTLRRDATDPGVQGTSSDRGGARAPGPLELPPPLARAEVLEQLNRDLLLRAHHLLRDGTATATSPGKGPKNVTARATRAEEPARPTAGTSRSAVAAPEVRLEERITREVQTLKGVYDGNTCYVAPGIPATKEAKARDALQIPSGETLIALLDLTVFGSARKAVVFGRRAAYLRYGSGDRPVHIVYQDAALSDSPEGLRANGNLVRRSGPGGARVVEVLRKVCAIARSGAESGDA